MQTTDEADGTLVVRHDTTAWMWRLVVAGVVFLGFAAWDACTNPARHERVYGCLGAAATLIGVGLMAGEAGRFAFDRKRRVVEWQRRFAWWRAAGTIAFEDVADVMVEMPIGDHGVPSRRITLRLASGRLLPLRAAYRPDHGNELLRVAERIRDALGQPQRPSSTPAGAIAALVDQGRTIEAIKELRRTRGLSLVEAKREVEALADRAEHEVAK